MENTSRLPDSLGLREKPTKWVPHEPLLLEQNLEGLQYRDRLRVRKDTDGRREVSNSGYFWLACTTGVSCSLEKMGFRMCKTANTNILIGKSV